MISDRRAAARGAVATLGAVALAAVGLPAQPAAVAGHWKREGGEALGLALWPHVCVEEYRDRVLVHGIRYDDHAMRVRSEGKTAVWKYEVVGAELVLERGAGKEVFGRFEGSVTEALDHRPLALPPVAKVPAERSKAIGAELEKRAEKDLEARRDPARQQELAAIESDNGAWLRKIVLKYGWIDSERFPTGAGDDAYLLAQNSGDVGLLLALLPIVEREVRAGRLDGQGYCLMYDRLQLLLAKRQRYGTQLGGDGLGSLYLQTLQEPDRVDELRKEFGLVPLDEYLAYVERTTGRKVKRLPPRR